LLLPLLVTKLIITKPTFTLADKKAYFTLADKKAYFTLGDNQARFYPSWEQSLFLHCLITKYVFTQPDA
jgi:hypothetical protein